MTKTIRFGLDLVNSENPVFAAYAFYVGVLVIKMLLMAFLTSRKRHEKKVSIKLF